VENNFDGLEPGRLASLKAIVPPSPPGGPTKIRELHKTDFMIAVQTEML